LLKRLQATTLSRAERLARRTAGPNAASIADAINDSLGNPSVWALLVTNIFAAL
jgi:hypothetical protein